MSKLLIVVKLGNGKRETTEYGQVDAVRIDERERKEKKKAKKLMSALLGDSRRRLSDGMAVTRYTIAIEFHTTIIILIL